MEVKNVMDLGFLFKKNVIYSAVGLMAFHFLLSSFNYSLSNNSAASLEINKTASQASIITGETFFYNIQYRCASLTDNCMGVVITDPLPPDIEFVGLLGSPHTINEVYDPITHTVTFTFQNTLNAGTVGQVQIEARFPNGVTPNGTLASNIATITGDNAPTEISNVDVTAIAGAYPEFRKLFVSGGAAGGNTTYQFMLCNNFGADNLNGTLNMENIVIIDTLPAGSVFVEFSVHSSTTASYDPVNHVVTFVRSSLNPGECRYPKVTVTFPDPPFSVGDMINNKGYLDYNAVGEPRDTIADDHDIWLIPINPLARGDKYVDENTLFRGNSTSYFIDSPIEGTEELTDFCITDNIPVGLEVTAFTNGAWYYGGLTGPEFIIDVSYTTNLSGPTTLPGGPFSYWQNLFTDVTDLGLTVGGPEYITSITWCFGDAPAGFDTYVDIEIQVEVMDDAPIGTITNCTELNSTTPGVTLIDDCVDIEVLPPALGANFNPSKSIVQGENLNSGDTITFHIGVVNDVGGSDGLFDPIALDLLPEGLTYVPGSWFLPSWGNIANLPNPTFTITSDYKGTGRELLKWEWSGANSAEVPVNERVVISFDVVINPNSLGGYPAYYNETQILSSTDINCWGIDYPDIYDFDDDGDTAELFCGDQQRLNINPIISLESEKLVKGQIDSDWTKYPNTGNTVPGGLSDYQLIVRNKGNMQLDSIVVIDILPHIGDMGVIDLNDRESRWRPNLVGPVVAPSGVTVYYSLEGNPCRSVEQILPIGPANCTSANWSTTPPSDITTVQSLKFEFGSTILNPNDSLILEWPMRAPINALSTIGAQADTIAWNSFGYIGQRVDNGDYLLATEPIKVGIRMTDDIPAVLGDYVWIDSNKNGIQDNTEVGLNGVRVELFTDNGDGISDPNTDTFVNFTVTTDGGYFLFPFLPGDDYFLVFYPPTDYDITIPNSSVDDANDSDGFLTTYNGVDVAITQVTDLSNIEIDLTWDLGIFPREICGNGIDDDGDGLTDNADDDCIALREICGNGIDDDRNNLIDEMDWECRNLDMEIVFAPTSCCSTCPIGDYKIVTPYTFGDDNTDQDPSNLAYFKPVYTSSRSIESYRTNPFYSVDGQQDNNAIATTLIELNPWLELDLVGFYDVTQINISAKTDCCAAANNNYTIILSETPFLTTDLATSLAMPGVNVYNHNQIGNAPFSINTTDRTRFVRVFLNGIAQLNIKEIEVIGTASSNPHPYQYSWNDISIGNTGEPSCLTSGTYTVLITDTATGETYSDSVVVP